MGSIPSRVSSTTWGPQQGYIETTSMYVLDDCYVHSMQEDMHGDICYEAQSDSSSESCWKSLVDLFHVNKHQCDERRDLFIPQ